jgi:hypothetical protein
VAVLVDDSVVRGIGPALLVADPLEEGSRAADAPAPVVMRHMLVVCGLLPVGTTWESDRER